LYATREESVSNWDDKDSLSLSIINDCLENNIVSHIRSCKTLHEAWEGLSNVFESQDVGIKMYLKNKLYTLKMKVSQNIFMMLDLTLSDCWR
jgi:hypothetical protein